jgi:hypothetical protein
LSLVLVNHEIPEITLHRDLVPVMENAVHFCIPELNNPDFLAAFRPHNIDLNNFRFLWRRRRKQNEDEKNKKNKIRRLVTINASNSP